MRLLPFWAALLPSAGRSTTNRSTNRAFRSFFCPEVPSDVLCCCSTSLCLDLRTVQLVTRLLVGLEFERTSVSSR